MLMDGEVLKESEENNEVLLGVVMQCDLKWSLQIEALTDKLKKRLTGLEKLQFVMDRVNKKSIVQGMFNSVLCYCLPLFGGSSNTEISGLQVLQNRAAKIVLNFPPRSSRDIMFDKLTWLTVRQLIAYHTLITVYRIRASQEPEHLAEMLSRDNHNGHIVVKNTRLELYRKSFVFRGSLLWNRLPGSLRIENKLSIFKKGVRSWVLETISRYDG